MSDPLYQPTVTYDFEPRNLPPDFLRAVGLVVAASAQTESIVQELIAGLLGTDVVRGGALTAHMSAPLRDNIARSLSELAAPTVAALDSLDDVLDAVQTATSKRNTIVHDTFARHPETNEIFSYRHSARGSYQLVFEAISVQQVEETAEEIYQAGMALMQFMMASGLMPTMPTGPLRETVNRRPSARRKRREAAASRQQSRS